MLLRHAVHPVEIGARLDGRGIVALQHVRIVRKSADVDEGVPHGEVDQVFARHVEHHIGSGSRQGGRQDHIRRDEQDIDRRIVLGGEAVVHHIFDDPRLVQPDGCPYFEGILLNLLVPHLILVHKEGGEEAQDPVPELDKKAGRGGIIGRPGGIQRQAVDVQGAFGYRDEPVAQGGDVAFEGIELHHDPFRVFRKFR